MAKFVINSDSDTDPRTVVADRYYLDAGFWNFVDDSGVVFTIRQERVQTIEVVQ